MSHKDTQRLCELLGASDGPGATDYDVDVSGNDIVVRCFRKIQYENGTMYESFVDMSTGLADGKGCVTRSAEGMWLPRVKTQSFFVPTPISLPELCRRKMRVV